MVDFNQKMQLYFDLRGTPSSSRESYLRRAKAFTEYIEAKDKDLNETTIEDIQQYILYLKKERGLSTGTINNYISSIRFFYTHVLDKEWNKKKLPRMRRIQKMLVIPPKQDVLAILEGTINLKHKAILVLLYGSGLRVSEVARLKICDICSKTMRVRVENAKHGTNRHTILSDSALKILRAYFKAQITSYKSSDWLFPGQVQGEHINVKTIKNTLIKLRTRLKLDPNISAHTLRHCFAAHLLEDGTEPAIIQQLLGHKSLSTTTGYYLHLTSKSMMGIKSPLDTK